MALKDFIQQLQEDDKDVVYSKPPEDAIQIIPPENHKNNIKVIPPEEEKPKVVFKIKQKEQPVIIIQPKTSKVEKEIQPQKEEKKTQEIKQGNNEKVELLFKKSETPLQYKQKWLEYYEKAVNSKKDNFTVKKIREGRFIIDIINGSLEMMLLPEYNVYGKKTDELLAEHWL